MKKSFLTLSALSIIIISSIAGCGLLSRKKVEDTDTYKDLMKHQEEVEKKVDSIKKENYKQLTDSSNNSFKKSMDSLKHRTDSLKQKLENNIKELKNKK